jgi:putative FmdB family regulatory protein
MPIYQYRCSSCGYEHEALQKVTSDLLVDCPKCDSPSLVKMVTAAGFQLKGAGWYVTDFKDKKQPEKGKDASKTSDDAKASPDTSTSSDSPEKTSTKASSASTGDE